MAQFKPGQSGNPEGRPKGIKDRRIIFTEIIESHKEELINKALEMALNGNEMMLKMFLERILPAKPKDNVVNIDLTGKTLIEKSNQVIESLKNQDITPYDAVNIMDVLMMQIRIYDAEEVAKLVAETKITLRELKRVS